MKHGRKGTIITGCLLLIAIIVVAPIVCFIVWPEQVKELFKFIGVVFGVMFVVFVIALSIPNSPIARIVNKVLEYIFFTLAGVAGIYAISPLDFLPDIIPGLGQADDVGALILGLIAAGFAFVHKNKAKECDSITYYDKKKNNNI